MLDLKALLSKILNKDAWAQLYASGFTGNNTASKVTDTVIATSDAMGEYFTVGTNQITLNKSGTYKITLCMRLSGATNNTNVKRLAMYRNNSESMVVMGRDNTWQDRTCVYISNLSKGDVLTMWRRAEDGNSTYSFGKIIIEYINPTT